MAGEQFAGEHTALQNPMILEHIFQYASVGTLGGIRLVSKLWRDTAKNLWKASATAAIGGNTQMLQFIELVQSSELLGMSETFENYSLWNVTFEPCPITQKFWSVFGTRIKSLKLKTCHFHSMYNLREILYRFCPNMQHLSLNGNLLLSENDMLVDDNGKMRQPITAFQGCLKSLSVDPNFDRQTGVSWIELFANFSTIEAFTVIRTEHNVCSDDGIYAAINKIRSLDSSKLNLKQLIVRRCSEQGHSPPISSSLMELLLDGGLHLQKLCICLSSEDTAERLDRILCQHGSSLVTLELNGYRLHQLFDCNDFPNTGSMEKLQHLTLYSQVFSTMEFLKWSPNLISLTVAPCPSSSFVSHEQNIILQYCTKLQLYSEMSVKDITKIISMMPNVKRLGICLNNDTLPIVCERWADLMSLVILDSDVDDEGLTRFDAKTVKRINEDHRNHFPDNNAVRKSNITNLIRASKL